MNARTDYPTLAGYAAPGTINGKPHHTETGKQFAAALDEIDRLRALVADMAEELDHFHSQWGDDEYIWRDHNERYVVDLLARAKETAT